MAQVVVTITTKPQDFPDGVVAGVIRVSLNTGQTQDVTGLTASFSDIPPGTYSAFAKLLDSAGNKLGDAVSAGFTVPVPAPVVNTLQVPDTVNVTVT